MNSRIHKTFLKELSQLPVKDRKKVEKFLFEEIDLIQNLDQITDFKKLKGYSNYYRIRFGEYRAGLRIENGILYFERILHRRNIYKYYP
jgi:mRNA interferase RelE/StbE